MRSSAHMPPEKTDPILIASFDANSVRLFQSPRTAVEQDALRRFYYLAVLLFNSKDEFPSGAVSGGALRPE